MTRRILIGLTMLLGTWSATTLVSEVQTPGDAERALRAAIETEMIRGDVDTAVAQYRTLAAGTDRAVAARALLRLARRQAIQGDAAAGATYQRVARDFSDQPGPAAEAAARLAALSEAQTGAQHRLIWDNAIDTWGSVSSDGRLVSFTDEETGDLAIRDLMSGTNRRLTNYGGYVAAHGETVISTISPDGRRVAFSWNHYEDEAVATGSVEVRTIDVDGSNQRTLLRGPEYDDLEPDAWSPDGSEIALHIRRRVPGSTGRQSAPGDVVIISADGRRVRVVASYPDLVPSRIQYSSDGNWLTYELRPQDGTSSSVAVVKADGSQKPATLVEDANAMGWTPDGRLLFSRERLGISELYIQPVAGGRLSGSPVKVTGGRDIGRPMGMTRDGRLFYSTTRRDADAVLADFDPASGRMQAVNTVGPAVGLGVTRTGGPQFSPDGRFLAMVTGPQTITIRDLVAGNTRTIFAALSQVLAFAWTHDGKSLLLAGQDSEPGIFEVTLATQATKLILRADTHVVAESPDGQNLYYRSRQGGVFAWNRRTGDTRQVTDWSKQITAMVLSPAGSMLALVSPNRLVFVNLKTGETRVRWETSEAPGAQGAYYVRGGAWTPDEQAFVTLARLQPSNGPLKHELWSLPANGGEPQRSALTEEFRSVSLTPDGRRIALLRDETVWQIWMLENFLPAAR